MNSESANYIDRCKEGSSSPDGGKFIRGSVVTLVFVLFLLQGCVPVSDPGSDVFTWGKRGLGDGQFQKPRAIAFYQGELFVADMTGRIQVFDTDGEFQRSWRVPEFRNGKPCGLSISSEGELMVADTHYFRVLFYSLDGTLLQDRTIGGVNGTGPGEFGFLTDVVQDSTGNFYVSEYGDFDRIQKFSPCGEYIEEWGEHGSGPGEFLRPQSMMIDEDDLLWVCDSANHRVQIFDVKFSPPKFLRQWGSDGREPGQLGYPYSIARGPDGSVLVCEFGNHRIQKFTRDGDSLGTWGGAGRAPGQLHQPWAFCMDDQGKVFVLDSYNHRVQRFPFESIGVGGPPSPATPRPFDALSSPSSNQFRNE